MSCIQSFTFLSSANETVAAPDFDSWGLAPQNYWQYNKPAGTSTFNIQGFKNVNIHGIEAQGDVYTLHNSGNAALVNDWTFFLTVNGQNPQVSGNITVAPNNYSIVTQGINPLFALSRYNNKFTFEDPIQSATNIQISGLRASGIGAENLALLTIAWTVNFVVYYSYEGE